jgi:hypothetical protein
VVKYKIGKLTLAGFIILPHKAFRTPGCPFRTLLAHPPIQPGYGKRNVITCGGYRSGAVMEVAGLMTVLKYLVVSLHRYVNGFPTAIGVYLFASIVLWFSVTGITPTLPFAVNDCCQK